MPQSFPYSWKTPIMLLLFMIITLSCSGARSPSMGGFKKEASQITTQYPW